MRHGKSGRRLVRNTGSGGLNGTAQKGTLSGALGYWVALDRVGPDGMTIGQDSDGRRWSTSTWQGIETTTVTPPGR